jgi:NAD(P)-dependent dehydrogenase (short-subunit alcohol dehydrogenase family)
MPGRVEGKVAVVTGSGTHGHTAGVGRATAVLLAREGAQVIVVDRIDDRANATLREIVDDGGKGTVNVADLGDPGECQRVVDETVEQFGGVDVLVNNAAVAAQVGMLEISHELYEQVMAVNVRAPFMLTKAALPVMIERGGGSVVNITSVAAIRGTGAPNAAYATSKGALLGMMIDVATSYGRHGVRVNCVAPGHVDTPFRADAAREMGVDLSVLDAGDRTALGFEGDAWDVARTVLFLSSDEARYVTGMHVLVDGGATTRIP